MKRSSPTIVSLVIIIAIGIAVFWNMRKAPPEGGAPIVATSTPSGSTPTIPAVTVVVDNLEISDGNGTTNRIERYRFLNDALSDKKVIISGIPGALYHDGGRMEFGADGMLYVTTGDATKEDIAQDKNSLGGKILRLNDDGSIPGDNPFPGSPVWSYGHRNPQGLAWDGAGRLWETEHGPTGENQECCRDEINLIEKGGNYGWPTITGAETRTGMLSPALQSGGSDTWAPASLAYYKGSLFFGGLRGAALYEAVLDGTRVKELKKH